MPAPNTISHTPAKVYFSPSEVMTILDCPRHWLAYWTERMAFKSPSKGVHHRYSVDQINELAKIRNSKQIGYLNKILSL